MQSKAMLLFADVLARRSLGNTQLRKCRAYSRHDCDIYGRWTASVYSEVIFISYPVRRASLRSTLTGANCPSGHGLPSAMLNVVSFPVRTRLKSLERPGHGDIRLTGPTRLVYMSEVCQAPTPSLVSCFLVCFGLLYRGVDRI